MYNYYNKKFNSKVISKIEKLKSQKKKIILIKENFKKEFVSFNECDRFLNMWRGFTSSQVVKNRKVILDYNYIIEDIV